MVPCSTWAQPRRYWFVHPLLAEVLEAGLLPEERRALHAAFVEALDGHSVSPDELDVERVVDLADHHYRAGHREEAYRWALLGAEAAGRAGGAKEMLRLLRRAFDLWPEVPNAEPSRLDLLQRIRHAADQAGAPGGGAGRGRRPAGVGGPRAQPLLAAELLVRRMILRLSTGREFAGLADVREAVRLSRRRSGQLAVRAGGGRARRRRAVARRAVRSGPGRGGGAARSSLRFGEGVDLCADGARDVPGMAFDGEELPDAQIDSQEAQAAAAEVRDFCAYVPCHAVGGQLPRRPDEPGLSTWCAVAGRS